MTITAYEPTDTTSIVMAPEVYRRLPDNILADGISSGDHKVIGRLWIFGALLFGLFTLVADILVRVERIDTDGVQLFSNASAYEQWFTLHRVSLVFLFVVPMLIGIANVVVPLQIGAPSLAFPRAAAAALWSWVVSGIMLIVSWAIDGGLIDRGDDVVNAPTQLSMVSFAALAVSIIVASMVIVTTIFTERSQGMSLYNVPLFTWSMLVAGAIWLMTLPVLVANLMIMWIDARGDAFHSFGGENLYQQVGWVFDQPQVFAFAIPVLGMLGEVVPVALRRRLKQYDLAMIAIGAFGAFSFGAYAQTLFNPNASTTWLYVLGSITLILPLLALLGAVALTGAAAGRAPQFSSHLVLAVAGIVALLVAGAVAAVRVADSLLAPVISWLHDAIEFVSGSDWNWLTRFENWIRENFNEVAGSSLSNAMVQLALVAGLLAAAAGLFYWAPKIFGHKLPAGVGLLVALSLLGGAVLSALPDAISGFLDQPDFVARGAQRDGVEILNTISLVGAIGVLAGVLALLAAVAGSFVFGDDRDEDDEDPRNPWGGHTLEWLTDSPPVPGNFAGPLVVTSEAPLLDDDFENPYAEVMS